MPKKNNCQSQTQIIKLNVGGQLFNTTMKTISSCDNTLRHIFTGDVKHQTDAEGCVFIDRSGKHFHSILNYLRDGSVPLPNDPCLLRELRAEAQYYIIEGLIHLCQQALDQINQETKPISSVPMVSSTEEMQHLIETTSKPVISLTINRTLYRCKNKGDSSRFYENIIKNIERFEKFSLKLSDIAVFVRDFTEQSEYGCFWSFHYEGRGPDVLCTDFNDSTCVQFPVSDINDAVMRHIINYRGKKNSNCEPPVQTLACIPKPEENQTPPPYLCEAHYPALNQIRSLNTGPVFDLAQKLHECKYEAKAVFLLRHENQELFNELKSFFKK